MSILQGYDRRTWSRTIMQEHGHRVTPYTPRGPALEGYYQTLADDGRPIVPLWQRGAPSQLDSEADEEVSLLRNFAAWFNSGVRARQSGRQPPEEACPLGIIIANGRWHTSHTLLCRRENCLQLSFASKLTGSQGSAFGFLHVSTKNDELDGNFHRLVVPRGQIGRIAREVYDRN